MLIKSLLQEALKTYLLSLNLVHKFFSAEFGKLWLSQAPTAFVIIKCFSVFSKKDFFFKHSFIHLFIHSDGLTHGAKK